MTLWSLQVGACLEESEKIESEQTESEQNEKALLAAIHERNLAQVKKYLKRGIDIPRDGQDKNNLLGAAVEANDLKIVQLLLSRGITHNSDAVLPIAVAKNNLK